MSLWGREPVKKERRDPGDGSITRVLLNQGDDGYIRTEKNQLQGPSPNMMTRLFKMIKIQGLSSFFKQSPVFISLKEKLSPQVKPPQSHQGESC